MMKISRIPTTLFLLFVGHFFLQSDANDPFLKEILMGRCYEQNRSSSSSTFSSSPCSEIVGSFMNVLESHSESDKALTEDLFRKAYVETVNFAPPKDKAMVWLELFNGSHPMGALPLAFREGGKHWTTPATTPGGQLLKGLTFCARTVYQNDGDCSRESSNAYWKFWSAAYAEFARSVEGNLEIVLEDPYVDEGFLHKSVLSHLDATKVTSVRLWGVDCTSSIATTTVKILKDEKEIADVVCKGQDLVELILCDANDPEDANYACGTYKRGKSESDANEGDASGYIPAASAAAATTSGAATATATATPTATATAATGGIHKDEKKSGGTGFLFPLLLLGIGGYLYSKHHYHGTMNMDCSSYDKYDCIKGDLVIPNNNMDSMYGGGSDVTGSGSNNNSSKSSKYSSFVNHFGGGSGSGGSSYGASQ